MPPRSQTTIAGFLATLSAPRRREVEAIRKLIRKHLPAGYEEVISKNMLVYQVPLARGHCLRHLQTSISNLRLSCSRGRVTCLLN